MVIKNRILYLAIFTVVLGIIYLTNSVHAATLETEVNKVNQVSATVGGIFMLIVDFSLLRLSSKAFWNIGNYYHS